MPPIASFALRGTARELTWYCLVALTPNDAGIAYICTSSIYFTTKHNFFNNKTMDEIMKQESI